MGKILKPQLSNTIESIEQSLKKIKVQTNAPVDLWDPSFCGNLDIRVKKDGSWFYQGSKINRINLIKLFSSILKKEGTNYFLVTPVEKIGIIVEFAPFIVISMELLGYGKTQKILFTTNVGETFELNYNHALRVDVNPKTNEPHTYVIVRRNLEALLDRKSFYRFIDLGCIERYRGQEWFGVWSSNCFFPIVLNKDLEI